MKKKLDLGPITTIAIALALDLLVAGGMRFLGFSWVIATALLWLPAALLIAAFALFAMLVAIEGILEGRR